MPKTIFFLNKEKTKKFFNHKIFSLAIQIILIFCVIWIALFSPLIILLNIKQFFLAPFNIKHIDQNIDIDEAYSNYVALINYLTFTNSASLQFPTYKISATGIIHFEDVKHILNIITAILIATSLIFIPVLSFAIWKKQFNFLIWSFLTALILILIIIIAFAIDADKLFIWFHKVFFNNDYWYFDPDKDEIIKVLPQMFFYNFLFFVFGISLCIFIFQLVVWVLLRKKYRKKTSY
ncbi:TIGR01906 family membrane protein [Mycoplasma iguanae]|uniref:TIGR01906 family membrane protein n=1 Tax=Mycoplasma iguanae TaxID=292461 RepID=A0ABY5R909_9MOLU|nr:TIGR01906 family membrane protein [Mycoplasma iguanae]UVD81996.1 TIGR01906 family membrane protein [Mycoplasma iguanae]